MAERSKLVSLKLRNLGCIGPEGLEVALDNIVCLVGRNNTGKSTVLRAYELAQGSKALAETDYCQWTPEDDFPEVELCVHIPDGIGNVDARWKQAQGSLQLVRSRWQWKEASKPVRQTWDPDANGGAGEWAEDGKAGGADNVFNSRLPQPLRADSLQDAFGEHDELLRLVIEPVSKELKQLQDAADSPLGKAIDAVVAAAMAPIDRYQEEIARISTNLNQGLTGVFPDLDVRIQLGVQQPTLDMNKALLAGSSIRFKEGSAETCIKQQGTGSRRALFWALLQVRNMVSRERKVAVEREKATAKLQQDLNKEKKKAKPNEEKIASIVAKIEAAAEPSSEDDVVLPGHILLMDEPENCLHPMAVRAAREHLYALAQDDEWQVMLSTHSPYFIDPLEDHTTIVRLERQGNSTSPKTFRTTTAQFSDDERSNLRALLQLDSALAEMFFGSYPVIVEGDTELAAFIAAVVDEEHPLSTQISVVPARGKALIPPLVRLLTHFEIPFGVLHDADSPKRRDGKRNSAWAENSKIAEVITQARASGVQVRHRVSIPDFERRVDGSEEEKDKPILMYRKLREDVSLRNSIATLFVDLFASEQVQPFDSMPGNADAIEMIQKITEAVQTWGAANAKDDLRFQFTAGDKFTKAATV